MAVVEVVKKVLAPNTGRPEASVKTEPKLNERGLWAIRGNKERKIQVGSPTQ